MNQGADLSFSLCKREALVAEQRQLNGKAEPIGVTAPGGDEIQIRAGQCLMSDQRVRIGRHAEQLTALSLGQQLASRHVSSGVYKRLSGIVDSGD